MKCHRGGSSEGLMAFNGCSLAEVRGDYVWGGELCCQGNQIGNILGNWKRTPSRVTSRACCRCLLQLCLHLQRWTSDFAWQGLGRSASCCWPSAEVDQDQRWAFHDMEKIGKPWQTHQGMQDFFWCFLKRDSISGLSDAWRMFHRHRNGIAYCEDKFAFEMFCVFKVCHPQSWTIPWQALAVVAQAIRWQHRLGCSRGVFWDSRIRQRVKI